MKKIFILAIVLFSTLTGVFSQGQFEVLPDQNGGKILKGIIPIDILEKDPAFKWFTDNRKGYTPYESGLAGLKKNADSVQLLVFMGTWCEDSHFVIPRLFSLIDQSGFSKDRVTLIGVDRTKKTGGHLTEALNIVNVPTILVMKNGKETGRVIEYGPDGLFDKELGKILGDGK